MFCRGKRVSFSFHAEAQKKAGNLWVSGDISKVQSWPWVYLIHIHQIMWQMSHGCHQVRHNMSVTKLYIVTKFELWQHLQVFDNIFNISVSILCVHYSFEESKHTWNWIKAKMFFREAGVKRTWFAMELTESLTHSLFTSFPIPRKYLPMYILYG